MQTVVDVILSRRSIREGYRAAPVPLAVLEDILRCGLAAPSSKNARPWRFHVVHEPRLLRELAEMIERSEGIETYVPFDPQTGQPRPEWSSTVLESAGILRSVPAAVFIENTGVFSRGRQALLDATPQGLAGSIVGYTFELMGVGAAIENMWIAAVAHGVSAVFMGDVLIAEQAIKRRLQIPNDLVGVLALGYAEPPPQARGEPKETDLENVRWLSQK